VPPHIACRKGERIHPHVVVFIDSAGLIARPRRPLDGVRLRPVGPVRFAPQRAFPVAGLAKHVIRCDGAIVRRVERKQKIGGAEAIGLVAGHERAERLDRGHVALHGLVDVADHPAVVRDPDHSREHALGDTVSHIDASRFAPFGDDVAVVNDEARRVAAVLDRTDGISERLATEGLVMVQDEIPRIFGLVGNRKVDGVLKSFRIEPGFPRRFVLPHRVRIVDGGSVIGPIRLRSGAQRNRNDQQSKDRQTNGHGVPPAHCGLSRWLKDKHSMHTQCCASVACNIRGQNRRIPMPRYLAALAIVLLPGMVLARAFLLEKARNKRSEIR
jgi:hypothetical protein